MTTARRHNLPLLLLPLLILHHRASAATQAEKDALLRFKSSITSDPQGALASWTPDGDPCRDFLGITCAAPSSGSSIQRVRVHSAALAGPLSPSLASLPSIQSISLFDNLLSGSIPKQVAAIPTLHKLNLSRNAFQGPVPPEIGAVQSLRLLDLSWNNLTGTVPPQLFTRTCSRLRYVSLAHNALTGPVPATAAACGSLEGLDLSFNALTGEIPPRICAPPQHAMSYLSFRSNAMSGTVDDRLVGCRALRLLDLGSNNFTGPPPLGLLRLDTLTYFNVSFNGFTGDVPGLACGPTMGYLDISGNRITGGIQPFVDGCRDVKLLALGYNLLTGGIPPGIGGMKSLTVLSLGGNPLLGGQIPVQIGDADLLVLLDLRALNLTGTIPDSIANLRFLLHLDASTNQLQGHIPATLYNMTYLKFLDLHSNRLDGSIPSTLGDLSRLDTLDLSQNSLDGPIPPSLTNLTHLSTFNLSYNNLSGQIPQDQALLRFGPEAFSHNPGLCGAPLHAVCAGGPQGGAAPGGGRRHPLLSTSAIVAIVAAAVILVGVCVIPVVNLRARGGRRAAMAAAAPPAPPSYSTKSPSLPHERPEEEEVLVSEGVTAAASGIIIGKLVLLGNGLPSRHEDWEAGTKALLDKNCVVGRGTVGTVYRATLEGGAVTVAVKKLEGLGSIRDQDEFEQEIGRLGGVRHPNLVAFHGYYWSPTAQLLLTEFVTNGNLYGHLHGIGGGGGWGGARTSGSQLPWPRRFGVAVGTARALAHLHHDCKPQLLHLNLKSTNILLDDDFRPKLSDYGLARLMLPHQRPRGYTAPELLTAHGGVVSDRCDVYSFGMVLLELVTGRQPAEASPSPTVGLSDYVRGLLERGAVASCFDRRLRGVAENELVQVIKFGLICTAEAPSRRASMAEVVQYLESIRPAPAATS